MGEEKTPIATDTGGTPASGGREEAAATGAEDWTLDSNDPKSSSSAPIEGATDGVASTTGYGMARAEKVWAGAEKSPKSNDELAPKDGATARGWSETGSDDTASQGGAEKLGDGSE